jgi:hypothetical protein
VFGHGGVEEVPGQALRLHPSAPALQAPRGPPLATCTACATPPRAPRRRCARADVLRHVGVALVRCRPARAREALQAPLFAFHKHQPSQPGPGEVRAAAGTGWAPGCSRRRPARRRTPSASGPAHFLAGPLFGETLSSCCWRRTTTEGWVHTYIHTSIRVVLPGTARVFVCVSCVTHHRRRTAADPAPPGRLTRGAALFPRSAHRRETGLPLSRRLGEKRRAWLLGACACVRVRASRPSVYSF